MAEIMENTIEKLNKKNSKNNFFIPSISDHT